MYAFIRVFRISLVNMRFLAGLNRTTMSISSLGNICESRPNEPSLPKDRLRRAIPRHEVIYESFADCVLQAA
jgi:hypothetical protein